MTPPRDRLPPLALFRAFEAAARHLSFKKAAAELNVTPAAVSQQIKALENQLGVPLFLRLTRALCLTEQGQAMAPKVAEAFDSLAAAVRSVAAPASAGGLLTVTAPPSFASHWLMPRLPAFHAEQPGIELRLASSSDAVDQAGEAATLAALNLAPGEQGCELVVLYGLGAYPGFQVDRLLTPELVPVCAPAWLTPDHPLQQPNDLCRQTLIHDDTFGGAGRNGKSWGWAQWFSAAGVDQPVQTSGWRFSNAMLAIEAALAGQGVALAARPMVAAQLAAGTLVAPFPIAIRSPYTYWLVARADTARRPMVAAFRSWVLAQAGLPAGGAQEAGTQRGP
jgi:LysR family glycine cleavage system transcriptional activator